LIPTPASVNGHGAVEAADGIEDTAIRLDLVKITSPK
jgi:hypothetical protein